MKPSHLAIVVPCLILGGVLWLLHAVDAQRPRGSDAAQIRAVVVACDRAAIRRDPAGVNRYISADYRDSFGFRADTARSQVAQTLRNAREVRAEIPMESEVVTVDPDRRHATAQFHLQFQTFGGRAGGYTLDGALVLRLAKEPVRYFLVFPGEEWRIVAAEGYAPEFLQ